MPPKAAKLATRAAHATSGEAGDATAATPTTPAKARRRASGEDAGAESREERAATRSKAAEAKTETNASAKTTTSGGADGDADADDGEGSGAKSDAPRTVFVSGLPFDAPAADAERAIRALCGKAAPCAVRFATWHDSGRLRGYAHVDFVTEADADAARERLDKADVGGRYLDARRASAPGKPAWAPAQSDDSKRLTACLFCKNVPYEARQAEVCAAFEEFGDVVDVRLPTWGHTGKSKGICYVTFKRKGDALKAVQRARAEPGVQLGGRRLVLDYEEGAPRNSFRDPDTSRAHSKVRRDAHAAARAAAAGAGARSVKAIPGFSATPRQVRGKRSEPRAAAAAAPDASDPKRRRRSAEEAE